MRKEVVVENLPEEKDEEYSDDLYNIQSWGADLSFRELLQRYEDDKLVKPELQRHFVWDRTEASRFIDSLLLGLPVPSIFLSRTEDEKLLIIDGYQRIMSVHDFIKGIWREDGKVFRLSNAEKINKHWRGKAFAELPEPLQRKIKNTTIHAIIFEQKKPESNTNSLFLIFERINTSGRSLNSQEIRNCIFQGELNKSLIELNNNSDWRSLFGSSSPDTRMRDIEQLLRLLSFFFNKVEEDKRESIQLKKYLNDYMEANKKNPIDVTFLNDISYVFSWINKKLTSNAFRTFNTKNNKYNIKFHPPLFDAITIACLKEFKKVGSLKDISNAVSIKLDLLNNPDFMDSISIRTTQIAKISKRIRYAQNAFFNS